MDLPRGYPPHPANASNLRNSPHLVIRVEPDATYVGSSRSCLPPMISHTGTPFPLYDLHAQAEEPIEPRNRSPTRHEGKHRAALGRTHSTKRVLLPNYWHLASATSRSAPSAKLGRSGSFL